MLHLLITNSVNEVHRVLELHTAYLPLNEDLKFDLTEKQEEVQRPNDAPQVTFKLLLFVL